MADFLIYRSCDISGTGVREALKRNADLVQRAVAVVANPSGLPSDPNAPTDTGASPPPEIDVIGSSWCLVQNTGQGQLQPGTYNYKLVPVDKCNGRTGVPIDLPPLTINTLGEEAILCVNVGTRPDPCIGTALQRDGVLVGPIRGLTGAVLDSYPVTTAQETGGAFNNGTAESFDIDFGTNPDSADLQIGDLVSYQGKAVRVVGVSGVTVTVDPPILLDTPPTPTGFFDLAQRTGVYFTDIISPLGFPIFIPVPPLMTPFPFPNVLAAFKTIAVPGLLATPQPGDLISYGSKTAIVVGVSLGGLPVPPTPIPPTPAVSVLDVGVIPLGLLPLPPLPAGFWNLIHRPPNFLPSAGIYYFAVTTWPLPPISIPSPATTYGGSPPDPSSTDPFVCFSVEATAGVPNDTNIAIGNVLAVNGRVVTITNVENGKDVDGTATPTRARVTFTPGFSKEEDVKFPLTGTGSTVGVYVALPPALSDLASLFMYQAGIAATGNYQRLTRLTETNTEVNIFQIKETGEDQERSGDLDSEDAASARSTLDQIFAQNGYPKGLTGLLSTVRGEEKNHASTVYNDTNGLFTAPTKGNRLIAVNQMAREGNGTLLDLTAVRGLRSLLCDSFSNVDTMIQDALNHDVSVYRYRSVTTAVPAESCPPGQSPGTVTELVCVGPATVTDKVKDTEQVRIFWTQQTRFQTTAKPYLRQLGLTVDETDAATDLRASGRVLSSQELPEQVLLDVSDYKELSPTSQDEILDETRILVVNTGRITRNQLTIAMRKRGRNGIGQRPTPEGTLIDDFFTPAHTLSGYVFTLNGTLDVCDFDAAINSLPAGSTRDSIAAVFALVEDILNGVVTVGEALVGFLNNPAYLAVKDTIAGLVMAVAADPTLGCLLGPVNQGATFGLPSIPAVDAFLQGFSSPFQVRFQLTQLLAQILQTLICAAVNGLLDLLPAGQSSSARRAINCLPSLEELTGFEFPSFEVQVQLECGLEQLQTILDILNEVIAEAAEVIAFMSQFGQGFIFQNIQARNNACSGDESFATVVGQAVRGLNLDQLLARFGLPLAV